MSDFTQTMKDWQRMCDAHINCSHCPLEHCISPAHTKWDEDFDRLERIVDAWAAEHPEPKYPTWTEYFRMTGVFPSWSGHEILDHRPIPAEIAEKLGIQPEEG